MPLTENQVKLICAELLQTDIDLVEFPGGSSRESVRVKSGGKGIIVTRRKKLQRAKLESGVLRILNQQHAPVPHLIACRDNYLIQQDVGDLRLSQQLQGNGIQPLPARNVVDLLESALASLNAIHNIGKNNQLLHSLPNLGSTRNWITTFVGAADRLGIQQKLPTPTLDYEKLVNLLTVERPTFIKWDARPGNAVVRKNGSVIWIDWEHCGKRHPLDDVAWLLTDEFTPYLPDHENDLINKILPAFAHGFSPDQALEYLRVYGTFHGCIRLSMILKYWSKDGWWDFDYCLKFDKVGVVKSLAIDTAKKISAWSQHSELTSALKPWSEELMAKLLR